MSKTRRFKVVIEGQFRPKVTVDEIRSAIHFEMFMLSAYGYLMEIEVTEEKDGEPKQAGPASPP